MTLPAYTRGREGEGQELGCGVRKRSHSVRSRPFSATRENMEREGPATSAQGIARGASRGISHLVLAWVSRMVADECTWASCKPTPDLQAGLWPTTAEDAPRRRDAWF